MKRSPVLAVALFCALCVSCQGPDPIRVRAERDSWALAQRCADGWFRALPFTAHDEQLVRASLADWDRRLKSDEQLIAAPFGGAR